MIFRKISPQEHAIMEAVNPEKRGRLGRLMARLTTNHILVPSAEGVRYGGSDMPPPLAGASRIDMPDEQDIATETGMCFVSSNDSVGGSFIVDRSVDLSGLAGEIETLHDTRHQVHPIE